MFFTKCVLRASRTTSSEYAVFTEASFFSKISFSKSTCFVIPSLLLLLLLESEEAVAEVLLPLPLDVARVVMLAAEEEEELAMLAARVFSSIFTSLSSFSIFFSVL